MGHTVMNFFDGKYHVVVESIEFQGPEYPTAFHNNYGLDIFSFGYIFYKFSYIDRLSKYD